MASDRGSNCSHLCNGSTQSASSLDVSVHISTPGFHAQDLSYEFSTFAMPPTVNDPAFLDAFRQSFMSAAIMLDPNVCLRPSILPTWAAWSKDHNEMNFGQNQSAFVEPSTTEDALLERCEFWRSFAEINSQ
ncbi:hypothetical protein B0H13DRAFT_2398521 [Mycena leptocephala]|nr:hypothetical protein B0H13DRAFT_2398521 [Mycena leptocephala]